MGAASFCPCAPQKKPEKSHCTAGNLVHNERTNQSHTMNVQLENITAAEAKDQIKAILQQKFAALIKSGVDPKTAILDVMGAFEQQFPGLAEKL
jgi:hypothetical protein